VQQQQNIDTKGAFEVLSSMTTGMEIFFEGKEGFLKQCCVCSSYQSHLSTSKVQKVQI
jgi:hypothetical protein